MLLLSCPRKGLPPQVNKPEPEDTRQCRQHSNCALTGNAVDRDADYDAGAASDEEDASASEDEEEDDDSDAEPLSADEVPAGGGR